MRAGRGRAQGDEERDRPLRLFRTFIRSGVQPPRSPTECVHLATTAPVEPRGWQTCDDHRPADGSVVHLRVCLVCDHVGCCDSSPPQHATLHAREAGHAVMQSAEPGESWRWCYEDELLG